MSRETIKAAALGLFQRISYVKTSVADIAAAAGIGKGSIYLSFKSKEEILFALLDDEIRAIRESLDPVLLDPQVDLATKLDLFTGLIVDQHFRIRDLMFGSFDNVEGRELQDVYRKFEAYIDQVVAHIGRVLVLHGRAPGQEPAIREFILTLSGRILVFLLTKDWQARDEVRSDLPSLARTLFAAFVP